MSKHTYPDLYDAVIDAGWDLELDAMAKAEGVDGSAYLLMVRDPRDGQVLVASKWHGELAAAAVDLAGVMMCSPSSRIRTAVADVRLV